ncbi:hypothetical protein [Acinetobacter sp. A47]|uniref:hypothetical protein n=1 Tax=Acinetobacter sp. A47 TaxID=1561217 RepID=UPI00056EF64D|nr:hypothetical protein [Acinetobacter sp. A47]
MSFITVETAEEKLGKSFAPDGDKARLVLLANTWMKKEIGFIPKEIDEVLQVAACEIIQGIMAKAIYNGKEQQLKRKRIKGDTVESEKEYQDGSVAISKFEQIAKDLIDSLDLENPSGGFGGFGIELMRV